MESESAFPASVEAAWGLRERPHKGPKRGLDLAGIVAAAVRVADAEGIDAASMGRVAKELGASTMALYRYVATKQELVTLMVDAAIGRPPPLPDGVGWRGSVTALATAMRAAVLAHPWTVSLMAANLPPAAPNQLAWLDRALQALEGTGLSEAAKLSTQLLVNGHVWSAASVEVAMMTVPDGDRLWAAYPAFLRRVTEDGRLPAMRAAIDAGVFEDTGPGPHDHFTYGLERLLDGIEAHIRSSRLREVLPND